MMYLITACIIIGSLTFGTTCVEPNCGGSGVDEMWQGLCLPRTSEKCQRLTNLRMDCVPPKET